MSKVLMMVFLWLAAAQTGAWAQQSPDPSQTSTTSTAPAASKSLRVGVSEVPPFVIHDPDGSWSGISIDLWNEVAQQLGYQTDWVPMQFKDVLPSLEAGKVDVAIGALTMTAEREEKFDFTHPFYRTGLAIAVPADGKLGALRAVGRLFSWQFLSVVLGLAVLLLVVGSLLWLFERRHNPEQFGGTAAQGLGQSFWWAAVTMTTVGYGDKAPTTLGGRLVAIVWMFAALVIVSGFTAAITAALTVGSLQTGIKGPADLQSATVATVGSTSSGRYLEREHVRAVSYPDLHSALVAVQQEKAEAVVYDQPILQYRIKELEGKALRLLPGTFENQSYGFAVASGSALREPISREILLLTNSDDWNGLKEKYLGPAPR